MGPGDRPERPLRRRGVLHAVAGHRLLLDDTRALRHRPDHRRVELRHRASRARPAGRRRRQPRRRRPLEQGRRLHGHPDADRRLLRDRLRGPRDGPPVQRQPPVQRHAAELLRRQPQRVHLGRARLGTSIMAYAGICLTDDLQAHSDPYFSERSLQEISTYTSSSQAAINEVQTASLRHFGGGNEQQVVTFGPGYSQASTIQPLSVVVGAAPSATQQGGAQEVGNTVTISTGAAGPAHTLQVGDTVTIAGVAAAGYNGTFTVTSVPTTRAFTYTNPIAGLPISGGGTVTLALPGATESGNTVTFSTSLRAQPVGRRRRHDRRRRRRGLQRHVHDHGRADAAHVPGHERHGRARQLRRRHGDVPLAVPGEDRRQRLRRYRRRRPSVHEREHLLRRSTRSPASRARSP